VTLTALICPRCGAPLDPDADGDGYITCSHCGSIAELWAHGPKIVNNEPTGGVETLQVFAVDGDDKPLSSVVIELYANALAEATPLQTRLTPAMFDGLSAEWTYYVEAPYAVGTLTFAGWKDAMSGPYTSAGPFRPVATIHPGVPLTLIVKYRAMPPPDRDDPMPVERDEPDEEEPPRRRWWWHGPKLS
jgi:hypothetical protein